MESLNIMLSIGNIQKKENVIAICVLYAGSLRIRSAESGVSTRDMTETRAESKILALFHFSA